MLTNYYMRRGQIVILWLGVAFVVAAGLYPPWIESLPTGNSRSYKPAGYAPIFRPPALGSTIISYAPEMTQDEWYRQRIKSLVDPLNISNKSKDDIWEAIFGPDASMAQLNSVLDPLPLASNTKIEIRMQRYIRHPPELLRVPPDTETLNLLTLGVDYGRLSIEWGAIILITAVVMVTARAKTWRRKSESEVNPEV